MTKKKNDPARRSAQAYAASVLRKVGAHQDSRKKRLRTRAARDKAALGQYGVY